jgi:hypothetical protein
MIAWRIWCLQQATHGHSAHTHVLGNRPDRRTSGVPLAYCLPACDAPRSGLHLAQFCSAGRWRRERWHDRWFGFGRHFGDDVLYAPTAAAENLVECGTGVGRQMETIGDLDCVRRALLTAFRVCARTIANDDLHSWMLAEPIGEHFRGPIVQQVNWSVRFEVNQERAISACTPLTAQSQVIDAQHSRRLNRWIAQRVQQSQQRIRAARNASLLRQTSATLATGLQRERGQQLGCVVGAASVAGQHAIEALGKNMAWARWDITEPPTAVKLQAHSVATPGKIERASLKPTVLPSTQLATLGARNGPARGFGNEDQTSIALDNDQHDAPVLTLPTLWHDHRHQPRCLR